VGYDMSGGEMGILFGIGVMYVVCFWLTTLSASAPPPRAPPGGGGQRRRHLGARAQESMMKASQAVALVYSSCNGPALLWRSCP